jgi:hypothetical protein
VVVRTALPHPLAVVLTLSSVVFFLVAFLSMCFTFSNTITRSIVGSLVGLLGVLVLDCILTTRESREVDVMATPEAINEPIDRSYRGWSRWYHVFVQFICMVSESNSSFGRNGTEV